MGTCDMGRGSQQPDDTKHLATIQKSEMSTSTVDQAPVVIGIVAGRIG